MGLELLQQLRYGPDGMIIWLKVLFFTRQNKFALPSFSILKRGKYFLAEIEYSLTDPILLISFSPAWMFRYDNNAIAPAESNAK
ncbi:hypothetical protein SAMN05216308_101124 [Nitrosospira sp. Nsp13]|nr:hypothetical protein SAMN05216308_101124 [Nitrosospira sp. Nsp13]